MVEGQLDSWQFDVIMDLVTNVFMAPLPKASLRHGPRAMLHVAAALRTP